MIAQLVALALISAVLGALGLRVVAFVAQRWLAPWYLKRGQVGRAMRLRFFASKHLK